MGAFSTIDIATTGAHLGSVWLEVLAHNMANLNTITPGDEEPFRAQLVVAQEVISPASDQGRGVSIAGFSRVDGEPARVWQPDHPLADEDGFITLPEVDMAAQMTDLILATRTYQANLSVLQSGREAYQSALRIGR